MTGDIHRGCAEGSGLATLSRVTDPDARYAGGCTPWGNYEVPALAGFLDEDLSSGWTQVRAWAQARDVTATHLDVMRQARATVVRAWPPTVNKAARAFVDQLDALIASMETMISAADSNGPALAGILTALTEAKKTVDGLHEQWKAQSSGWESTVLDVAVPLAGAAQQKTAQDRRAQLNTQARKVMQATDDAVYAYMPQLVVVPPPPRHEVINGPVDVLSPTSTAGSRSAGAGSIRPPIIPAASPPAAVPPQHETGSPVLAMAAGTTSNDVAGGSTPGVREQGSPTYGVGPVPSVGAVRSGFWVDTPAGRALRSGAVLGEPLEAPRPIPEGGVAPGSADRAGPAGPDELEPGLWGGVAGGRSRGTRQRERTLPADTVWPVPTGVPPVLEPGPEPVHDPGPGVIGIDR